MVICTRERTPFNLPSPSTPSHLLFLLLWETDSQNRWHRLPRQTPYSSDENVRWYCLVLPPVLSVMTIFSLQASLHIWTAVQLSLLQKNAQVGLGFEFTGWIMRARGQCGHLCGQVTRDQWDRALSGHLTWVSISPPQLHSGLCKTPEAQTQARGDQARRERQTWLILLPPLEEWDMHWGQGEKRNPEYKWSSVEKT